MLGLVFMARWPWHAITRSQTLQNEMFGYDFMKLVMKRLPFWSMKCLAMISCQDGQGL